MSSTEAKQGNKFTGQGSALIRKLDHILPPIFQSPCIVYYLVREIYSMAIPPCEVHEPIITEDSFIYNTGAASLGLHMCLAIASKLIRYSVVASMFILWDHCITFGQEEFIHHALSLLGSS